MYFLCYQRSKLLIDFTLKSGLISSQRRMLMVRVPSLIHVMLLVELPSPLIASHFHGLQFLQFPFIHVERPTEGDMGANRSVNSRAVVTDKDSN